jgi:FkbM family methyltransferase
VKKINFGEGLNHICDISRLNKDSVIIDAGCNVGLFVQRLRSIAGLESTQVVGIEPSLRNCEVIDSKGFSNFKLLNLALVGQTPKNKEKVIMTEFVGELKSDGTNRYHQWNNIYGNHRDKVSDDVLINEYEVGTTTIQEIIDRFAPLGSIDFLKMDIEGAEYEVLENLTVSTAKQIKQISFEEHDDEKNQEVKKTLRNLGFSVEQYPGKEIYAWR